MDQIEFLVPGTDGVLTRPEEFTDRTGRFEALARRHLPTTVAATLWAVAAVLCVVAPERVFYTQFQPTDGGEGRLILDGWGRLGLVGFQAGPPGEHGVRYGVALVACAVVFAALAVSVAGLAWRAPAWLATPRGATLRQRVLPAIGLLAVGVTAGSAVAARLELQSVLDSIQAENRAVTDGGGQGSLTNVFPTIRAGSFVWVTLVAAGVGLLAVLATWLPGGASADSSAAEPEDSPETDDAAGAEAAGGPATDTATAGEVLVDGAASGDGPVFLASSGSSWSVPDGAALGDGEELLGR